MNEFQARLTAEQYLISTVKNLRSDDGSMQYGVHRTVFDHCIRLYNVSFGGDCRDITLCNLGRRR
jgi:hypothetical protein